MKFTGTPTSLADEGKVVSTKDLQQQDSGGKSAILQLVRKRGFRWLVVTKGNEDFRQMWKEQVAIMKTVVHLSLPPASRHTLQSILAKTKS